MWYPPTDGSPMKFSNLRVNAVRKIKKILLKLLFLFIVVCLSMETFKHSAETAYWAYTLVKLFPFLIKL